MATERDDGDRVRAINGSSSSSLRSFFAAVSDPETGLDDLDVSALVTAARERAARTVGPRRSDETPGRYRVRVFADLLGECCGPGGGGSDRADRRRDAVLYARHAAETGDAWTARRWHLLSIVTASGPLEDDAKNHLVVSDSLYWILFGTLFARQRDFDTVLECAQKAMDLDAQNKLGLFVQAATLMTVASGADENIETLLKSLNKAYPRFSEGHLLAAVFYRRIEVHDLSTSAMNLAQRFIGEQVIDCEAERSLLVGPGTVWKPIDHGDDAALKFAMLLLQLEFADLANLCLRSFTNAPRTDAYHYLMAVSHYKCGEFDASLVHLNSMSNDKRCRRKSLQLLAHNKYGMGQTQEAVFRYVGLSFSPTHVRYSMAYSRSADHFMAVGRYVEATDAFHRACSVTGNAPALMIKLGVCLLALRKYPEAETILAEAVAMDGANNGDAWHYLGEAYERLGFDDMSDVCHRQAIERGSHF